MNKSGHVYLVDDDASMRTSLCRMLHGNMVYVKIPAAQVICVVDADGKVQSKAMEPGLGRSFYGKPPFKLMTSGLSSAEVFFQGLRVRPSNADSKSILLVQAD
jgi:hypothetical protein